jgi:methionyl-tRNA synthetase
VDYTSPSAFYLTTAINYTNGAPHFGHAYEAILSDIITRYHRACGRDVFFLTVRFLYPMYHL